MIAGRNASKNSNYLKVNFETANNGKLERNKPKKVKLLKYIEATLASQPNLIAKAIEPFAMQTLDNALRLRFCNERIVRGFSNPNSLVPNSSYAKFTLTCHKDFKESPKFKELVNETKEAKKVYKDKIKHIIFEKNVMEKRGAKEKLVNCLLKDLVKFYSLYSIYAKTSDRKLRNLNIDMSDKDIGSCLIHEFLTNLVDEPYRTYLDLSESELKNLQQKWTKTRDSLLKKVKTRSSLLAMTEQAEYCLTPRDEEKSNEGNDDSSCIVVEETTDSTEQPNNNTSDTNNTNDGKNTNEQRNTSLSHLLSPIECAVKASNKIHRDCNTLFKDIYNSTEKIIRVVTIDLFNHHDKRLNKTEANNRVDAEKRNIDKEESAEDITKKTVCTLWEQQRNPLWHPAWLHG